MSNVLISNLIDGHLRCLHIFIYTNEKSLGPYFFNLILIYLNNKYPEVELLGQRVCTFKH